MSRTMSRGVLSIGFSCRVSNLGIMARVTMFSVLFTECAMLLANTAMRILVFFPLITLSLQKLLLLQMKLRSKKKTNFKDVIKGKVPTKKQTQIIEYVPKSIRY